MTRVKLTAYVEEESLIDLNHSTGLTAEGYELFNELLSPYCDDIDTEVEDD